MTLNYSITLYMQAFGNRRQCVGAAHGPLRRKRGANVQKELYLRWPPVLTPTTSLERIQPFLFGALQTKLKAPAGSLRHLHNQKQGFHNYDFDGDYNFSSPKALHYPRSALFLPTPNGRIITASMCLR